MFKFLLVVHALIAIAMVGVILMQRSEGGGLAGGGSPAGLMSARGASNFLTRATAILAVLFVLVSIGLAALATYNRAPRTLDTSLQRPAAPVPTMPAPAPGSTVPLATGGVPAPQTVPGAEKSSPVPLAAPARAPERSSATVTRERPAEGPAARTAAPPPVTPVAEKAAPAPAASEPAPSGTRPQ